MHTLCFSFLFLATQGTVSCVATPAWFQVLIVHVSAVVGQGKEFKAELAIGGEALDCNVSGV